jgi:hypothetical protein
MSDLYSKASFIFIASAYSSSKVYAIKPNDSTKDLTFATGRTSAANRVASDYKLQLVSSSIPRLNYTSGSSCPAFLFESDRTNYLYNTDYLATGSGSPTTWQTMSLSWSLDVESTSPLGTGYSGLIKENPENSVFGHYIYNTYDTSGVVVDNSMTISVYVKRSGSNAQHNRNLMINVGPVAVATGSVYFILDGTGSIYNPSVKMAVSGARIQALADGWYRCSVLAKYSGSSNPAFGQIAPIPRFYMTSGSTHEIVYTGNGIASLYIAGAQLESGSSHTLRTTPSIDAGTYVTSYISSTSSSRGTRTADFPLNLPTSSDPYNFTILHTAIFDVNSINAGASLQVTSGSNAIAGFLGTTGIANWNSGSGFSSVGSNVSLYREHNMLLRFSNNNLMTWFVDGVKIHSQSFSIANPKWDRFVLNRDTPFLASFNEASAQYRVVLLYDSALTDAECIFLTQTGSNKI